MFEMGDVSVLCSGYPLTLYGWLELPHNFSKYNKHSKQFLRTLNTQGGAINPFNCVDINLDSTNIKVCCQAVKLSSSGSDKEWDYRVE